MNESLQELVKRILDEIKKDGDSPESIRKGIGRFVVSYYEIISSEARKSYDEDVVKFIVKVVGPGNLPAIDLYRTFYESEKINYRKKIEARPMPTQ